MLCAKNDKNSGCEEEKHSFLARGFGIIRVFLVFHVSQYTLLCGFLDPQLLLFAGILQLYLLIHVLHSIG